MSLESHLIVYTCVTDQCNDDLARDKVPQTKAHVLNLSQLIEVYITVDPKSNSGIPSEY